MDAKSRVLAEEAIRALGRGDAPSARTFVAEAVEADGKLGALADAVHLACSEIEADGEVSPATWNVIADVVASEGLLAIVEASRP